MSYLSVAPPRTLARMINGRFRDTAITRHRQIMSLFPTELGDLPRKENSILFRLDSDSNGTRYLIRSSIAPAAFPGVRTMEENFDKLLPDTTVALRVTLNNVKRTGNKERTIVEYDELETWSREKLSPALANVEIVLLKKENIFRSHERQNSARFSTVQLDAIATVEDTDSLKRMLYEGVGRGKSYGAGLLTVRPLR